MRSRRDDVDWELAVERALRLGLVGIGGILDRPPQDLEHALADVSESYGERVARRLERFAAVPEGCRVWTRDQEGRFWGGTIVGRWRYDDDAAALAADLVHVRETIWGTACEEHRAPPEVVASFARGGRNFQQIHPTGR